MEYALIFVGSYLIGSIPNGFIVGKFFGIDIRNFGSKNIGATNVYRVLGPKPAFIVFLCDAAKGLAGVYLGQLLFPGNPVAAILGGIGAIAGHNWSVFLGFKGGRGVATAVGVIALLIPKVTAVVFLVWLVIVLATRYVSLGSVIAAFIAPILIWAFGEQTEFLYFGVVAAAFVIVRHKANIERLLKGQELKIKAGGAGSADKEEKQ